MAGDWPVAEGESTAHAYGRAFVLRRGRRFGSKHAWPTHRDKTAMNGAQPFLLRGAGGGWIGEWATCRIDEIVRYCSTRRTFPFILIDPLGWKLAGISQISPLLKLKPGEVVINLMSSFITRLVNDTATILSDLLG